MIRTYPFYSNWSEVGVSLHIGTGGLIYILIDFENVQPIAVDMALLRGANYRVRLFHGPNQNRFDAAMVKALQPLGSQLEYIQGERKGKNALDFHIAFYLGRLVETCKASGSKSEKEAAFAIVSKDAGFDALLGPIQALGHRAARTPTVFDALAFATTKEFSFALEGQGTPKAVASKAKAPVNRAKKTPAKSEAATQNKATKPDPYQRALANLQDHPNNRPSKFEALERHLGTCLGKGVTQLAVTKVIDKLQAEGVMVVNGEVVPRNRTAG